MRPTSTTSRTTATSCNATWAGGRRLRARGLRLSYRKSVTRTRGPFRPSSRAGSLAGSTGCPVAASTVSKVARPCAGHTVSSVTVLRAVPGIRIVNLDVPSVGLQSVNLATLPKFKAELQLKELEAARAAGVDALVAVYHSDHRELCAHERDWPFKIVNILEIVGASMGLHHDGHFKRLKIMQDADAIVADCGDMLAARGIDMAKARDVVVKAMLAEQQIGRAHV